MAKSIDEYVPRGYYMPTTVEVLSKRGICSERLFRNEVVVILNVRALRWLNNAASYAYATLNAVIDLFPEDTPGREYRKYFKPILEELVVVNKKAREDELNESDESKLDSRTLDQRIKNLVKVVAQADNVFNNSVHYLPNEVQKAVLEARDVCEEALRQPRLLKIS